MSLRELVKSLARAVASALVLPALCSFYLRGAVLGQDRALEGSSQAFGLIPGLLGEYLRRAFLARALSYCAPSATIGYGALFSATGARIDELVYIGPRCDIGLVHLEREVLLGPAVQIPSGHLTHGIADASHAIRDQPGHHRLVRIGAGAWIGAASVVMADVGRGAVVGAGAVVTKPIPEGTVAGGVPARVLRSRTRPVATDTV